MASYFAKPNSLFITGTDTGVGKTRITALLAQAALSQGLRVAVYKPVETGITATPQSDTQQIAAWLGRPERLHTEVGMFFPEPAAPSVADREKVLRVEPLLERLEQLQQAYDVVLVEGAGGVQVPVTDSLTIQGLILAMQLPAVVVGRVNLGTINHSLLSINSLQAAGIAVNALVLNEPVMLAPEEKESLAVQTVKDQLLRWASTPVLGPVTHDPTPSVERFKALSTLLAPVIAATFEKERNLLFKKAPLQPAF